MNLVEILKDCPKGMELDCTISNDIVFEKIKFGSTRYPVVVRKLDTGISIFLTKYGQYVDDKGYKCVIFPKGKTTWEGFVPPREFKDGDIVTSRNGDYIFMLKKAHIYKDDDVYNVYNGTCYFGLAVNSEFLFKEESEWYFNRLATEEEKQELFKAIKENGFKWNEETKTLEELIEPKFKVGDMIRLKNGGSIIKVTSINSDNSICVNGMSWTIKIKQQDNYELVSNKFDINTLVPFESKVLVRESKTDVWQPAFYGFFNQHNKRFYTTTNTWSMCIPYNEDTKHLIGTTNDCEEFYKTWK